MALSKVASFGYVGLSEQSVESLVVTIYTRIMHFFFSLIGLFSSDYFLYTVLTTPSFLGGDPMSGLSNLGFFFRFCFLFSLGLRGESNWYIESDIPYFQSDNSWVLGGRVYLMGLFY